MKLISRLGTTFLLMLFSTASLTAVPAYAGDHKVVICHATGSTTNPYNLIEVAKASILNGKAHSEHQDTEDIIPPFEGFEGRNWTTEGQAVHSTGCMAPVDGPVTNDPETPVEEVPETPVEEVPEIPETPVEEVPEIPETPVEEVPEIPETPVEEVPEVVENPLVQTPETVVVGVPEDVVAVESYVAPAVTETQVETRNDGLNVQTAVPAKLADTGASQTTTLMAGVFLLLVGSGAVFLARRSK